MYFATENGQAEPSLFICGDSAMWMLLDVVFGRRVNNVMDRPVWHSADFSYYNRELYSFPAGEITAWETTNYDAVLQKNFVILEFTETNISINAPQFIFAENLLAHLKSQEGANK
jgi:hypothetical protein